jgi:hypothetical protein
MINMGNALVAPRDKFMNIIIMIDQEEDHQHRKCISSTKKGAHEHHDHDQLGRRPLTQEVH